jgi:2-(1,2-epoxy-1,2-dihydrophenyl)acetyl-CoA isomerase
MEFKNVLFDRKGGVAVIRMNMPRTFNAFNMPLGTDLIQVLECCAYDETVRAVVLTGEGKAFCAGGDIGEFKLCLDSDPSRPLRELIPPFNRIINLIRRMPKPVIGAINGIASGGGMSLAVACDYRVAGVSAKFKQAYTSIGLSGDGAWELLVPLLIGFARATELVLFDPTVDAQKALDWNLVHMVVADDQLMETSMGLAGSLASGATKAFAVAKENLNHAMAGILDSQLRFELDGMVALSSRTKDYQEGIKSFLERRRPEYVGG